MKKVTVLGSGVLGAQIAFQTAYKGFEVTVFDVKPVDREVFSKLGDRYRRDLGATEAEIASTLERLSFTSSLPESVKDADLVIEAVPENPAIKTKLYLELAKVAPAKTIFATNSSTLLPSQFAAATGRPDRFLALHFANEIWIRNTAEIMGHTGTDPEVFSRVVAFAKAIGMVALPLQKEQPGYILNSLLVPFLDAALALNAKGVADHETIDKTWMLATGSPIGPFGALDVIGLRTHYNVTLLSPEAGSENAKRAAGWLKENFLDKNKLGTTTGEGFYRYPNPRYLDPDFLRTT